MNLLFKSLLSKLETVSNNIFKAKGKSKKSKKEEEGPPIDTADIVTGGDNIPGFLEDEESTFVEPISEAERFKRIRQLLDYISRDKEYPSGGSGDAVSPMHAGFLASVKPPYVERDPKDWSPVPTRQQSAKGPVTTPTIEEEETRGNFEDAVRVLTRILHRSALSSPRTMEGASKLLIEKMTPKDAKGNPITFQNLKALQITPKGNMHNILRASEVEDMFTPSYNPNWGPSSPDSRASINQLVEMEVGKQARSLLEKYKRITSSKDLFKPIGFTDEKVQADGSVDPSRPIYSEEVHKHLNFIQNLEKLFRGHGIESGRAFERLRMSPKTSLGFKIKAALREEEEYLKARDRLTGVRLYDQDTIFGGRFARKKSTNPPTRVTTAGHAEPDAYDLALAKEQERVSGMPAYKVDMEKKVAQARKRAIDNGVDPDMAEEAVLRTLRRDFERKLESSSPSKGKEIKNAEAGNTEKRYRTLDDAFDSYFSGEYTIPDKPEDLETRLTDDEEFRTGFSERMNRVLNENHGLAGYGGRFSRKIQALPGLRHILEKYSRLERLPDGSVSRTVFDFDSPANERTMLPTEDQIAEAHAMHPIVEKLMESRISRGQFGDRYKEQVRFDAPGIIDKERQRYASDVAHVPHNSIVLDPTIAGIRDFTAQVPSGAELRKIDKEALGNMRRGESSQSHYDKALAEAERLYISGKREDNERSDRLTDLLLLKEIDDIGSEATLRAGKYGKMISSIERGTLPPMALPREERAWHYLGRVIPPKQERVTFPTFEEYEKNYT